MTGRRAPWRRAAAEDDGRILILTLGFVVLIVGLISVLVSVTALHLDRKELLAVADAAALAAADTQSDADYYERAMAGNGSGEIELTDAGVRAAVEAYLAAHTPDDLRPITIVEARAEDSRTVRVVLAAQTQPAWLSWATSLGWSGVHLQATSSARSW